MDAPQPWTFQSNHSARKRASVRKGVAGSFGCTVHLGSKPYGEESYPIYNHKGPQPTILAWGYGQGPSTVCIVAGAPFEFGVGLLGVQRAYDSNMVRLHVSTVAIQELNLNKGRSKRT